MLHLYLVLFYVFCFHPFEFWTSLYCLIAIWVIISNFRKNGFSLDEDPYAPPGRHFILKAVPFSKNVTFGVEGCCYLQIFIVCNYEGLFWMSWPYCQICYHDLTCNTIAKFSDKSACILIKWCAEDIYYYYLFWNRCQRPDFYTCWQSRGMLNNW